MDPGAHTRRSCNWGNNRQAESTRNRRDRDSEQQQRELRSAREQLALGARRRPPSTVTGCLGGGRWASRAARSFHLGGGATAVAGRGQTFRHHESDEGQFKGTRHRESCPKSDSAILAPSTSDPRADGQTTCAVNSALAMVFPSESRLQLARADSAAPRQGKSICR
jgi:hypothetical protein